MWKKSSLTILNFGGFTSKKRKVDPCGFKYTVPFDLIIEQNHTFGYAHLSLEDFESTIDLVSGKQKTRPKKYPLRKNNFNEKYLKSYAIKKAKSLKFIPPEEDYWIKSDYEVEELYISNMLASRIYKVEEQYETYIFIRNGRLDDHIRFNASDIEKAKERALELLPSGGWRKK